MVVFAHTQIKQVQPELFCNSVLEQAPSWHSASDRAMMTKLVKAGHERVSGTSSQTIISFVMWCREFCQDETSIYCLITGALQIKRNTRACWIAETDAVKKWKPSVYRLGPTKPKLLGEHLMQSLDSFCLLRGGSSHDID